MFHFNTRASAQKFTKKVRKLFGFFYYKKNVLGKIKYNFGIFFKIIDKKRNNNMYIRQICNIIFNKDK